MEKALTIIGLIDILLVVLTLPVLFITMLLQDFNIISDHTSFEITENYLVGVIAFLGLQVFLALTGFIFYVVYALVSSLVQAL